jgi:Tat protein secretion system quality control protein TatD with DNase activity
MGRRQRKNSHDPKDDNDHGGTDDDHPAKNRNDDHDDDDDDGDHDDDDRNTSKEPAAAAGLNFAQRRELHRQQAAEKRRSKQKCYLCGKAGHVRRQCPGIADDGRGMSRYKGKSDVKTEQEKYQAAAMRRNQHQPGRGRRSGSGSYDPTTTTTKEQLETILLEYPTEFSKEGTEGENLVYFDIQCDVLATIDYLRSGRGKVKLSQKEAMEEYQTAMTLAAERSHLQAILTKSVLARPDRPWTSPIIDWDFGSSSSIQVFFSLGLDKSWKLETITDEEAAIQSLVTTIHENKERVIALHTTLDYSADVITKLATSTVHQKSRWRCCCEAAGQTNLPLQIQILPGAGSLDPDQENVAGTDYAHALLDFQSRLSQAILQYPLLQVHLVSWSGRASHMMALLKAFPNNILAIGLDGAVTFTKATYLHECAFEVPLDKLVLATTHVIPSNVANTMGRTAFPQSGWWPFLAASVTHHKKTRTVTEIVTAVYENCLKLYPQLGSTATMDS